MSGLGALVTRWQDSYDLVVCSGRLVNTRTGEMARARMLEPPVSAVAPPAG